MTANDDLQAFYLPRSDGDLDSTSATSSPWDESLQHGGPPAALLVRAVEAVRSDPSLQVARITADMLGGIPQGRVHVEARVVKPGRRVEMVEARLSVDDRPAVTATAWLIRATTDTTAEHATPPAPLPPLPETSMSTFFDGVSPSWGYGRAIDWRFVEGGYEPGPATVWARLRVPLVLGEETSPTQRLLTVADSTNGLSGPLPMREWFFIPPTVTATMERAPESEWMLLEARTTVGPHGIGTAVGRMADERGHLATITQPLMVAAR